MMRTRGAVVAGILVSLSVAAGDAVAQSRTRANATTRPAPAGKVTPLAGDDAAIAAEVDRLAAADKSAAAAACRQLLMQGRPDQRPLATALFLRVADAKAIAALARELRPNQFHDERRLLVRALGRADASEALGLLETFVRDGDALVRAAAASALADHGRPLAVGLFVQRMPTLTDYWDVGGSGDEHIFGVAVIGAFRELTGERPETAGGLKTWWDKSRKDLTPATSRPTRTTVPAAASPAEGRLLTDAFDIRFQPRGLDQTVARGFGITGADGWATFAKDLETRAAAAREAAAPLFGGTLHLSLTRIDFANTQTFGGVGGLAGRGGVATRCRIAFNVDQIRTLEAWREVVRHEYVHVIQMAQFAQMPRWLAEGMAESLTESTEKSAWSPARITQRQIAGIVERGGVSEAINWQTGGVTGNAEPPKYAISHLLVDFLRFGPISEPETRLFFLMGELNRGTPAKGAMERVYGKPLAQLDRDFATWARELKAQ